MQQQLIREIAYGQHTTKVIKSKNNKRAKSFERLLIWIFSFIASIMFIFIPYMLEPSDNKIDIVNISKDYAVPLLTITTSITTVIECVLSDMKYKASILFHLFLLLWSTCCYYAYFQVIKLGNNNFIGNHALYISIGLVILSIIGEIIFVFSDNGD